jgi:ATP-dependent Clp protease ATP-binding subunit ClpB
MAHEVETRIAKALLRGDLTDGAAVRVDVRDDELVVHHDPQPAGV